MTVFPNGTHDDQVDSTAQFLDWFKKSFPGQNIYELYRRDAEAVEERRQPQPAQTVWSTPLPTRPFLLSAKSTSYATTPGLVLWEASTISRSTTGDGFWMSI